jgi:DNA-binding MarR family transcriptional regulator
MSRLVATMDEEGLVKIEPAQEDARSIRITPTARGKALLLAGKKRRVDSLAKAVGTLGEKAVQELEKAIELLRGIIREL